MGEDCKAAIDAGGDLLHIDVMDGHFVPNLSLGPDMCRDVRRYLPDAFLDVHLMVTDPDKYIQPFCDAGADHITFHIEVCQDDIARELAQRVKSLGMSVGIAINPPTALDEVLPVLTDFDLILVMSVNPGFGGQAFIEESLDKIRQLSQLVRDDQRLEMDGGIDTQNASTLHQAGCDVLVAGSALFKKPIEDWPTIITALQGKAG